MPVFAITATDTGVGKTFVACGIARAMRHRGIDVGVFKPFCTGDRSDVDQLTAASACGDRAEEVNPCFFTQPLAPYRAAELAGAPIAIDRCVAAFDVLRQRHDVLIVEGAGGVMVPLCADGDGMYSMRDFLADIAAEAVVVARRTLGTINHTWLTVDACRARGIAVRGVVFNDAAPVSGDEPQASNPALAARCASAPLLAHVPHNPPDTVWDSLADHLLGVAP